MRTIAIDDAFKVELTDHEMFLILNGLEKKMETTTEEKSKEYQALYDRLTDIYEGRVSFDAPKGYVSSGKFGK